MLLFLRPGASFSQMLTQIIYLVISMLVITFFVTPFHEWAHGFVAYKLGDKTAKNSGRLSLNPLKHIDPIGILSIFIFGIGWAKPVPVDSRNFKNKKVGMALVGLAGPIANIIAAVFFSFLSSLTNQIWSYTGFGASDSKTQVFFVFYTIFSYLTTINISLALFNLLPIPPLDGSRIIGVFLSDKAIYSFYKYERYLMLALFILMVTGLFYTPFYFLVSRTAGAINFLVNNVIFSFLKG